MIPEDLRMKIEKTRGISNVELATANRGGPEWQAIARLMQWLTHWIVMWKTKKTCDMIFQYPMGLWKTMVMWTWLPDYLEDEWIGKVLRQVTRNNLRQCANIESSEWQYKRQKSVQQARRRTQ